MRKGLVYTFFGFGVFFVAYVVSSIFVGFSFRQRGGPRPLKTLWQPDLN